MLKKILDYLLSYRVSFSCPSCKKENYQEYTRAPKMVVCSHCYSQLDFGKDLLRVPVY
mgnify:CR=1 FL=1